jgi:hypothetical protein
LRALDLIKLQCYALENQCRFVCRDLRVEDFKWRSNSGSPSIGWQLGHILLAHDRNLFIGNQPVLPEDYKDFFGFKSSGNFPDSCDPNLLLDKLKEINGQILTALSPKDDAWLSEKAADEKLPPHLRGKAHSKCFVSHFSHCFTHAGQILELRRMLGKEGWGF